MYWKELKSFFDSWNIKHPAGMSEACWFQGLFLAFCVCTDMRPSLIVLRNKARWMCLWNTFFLVRRLFQKMFDLSQLGHFPVSWRLVENKALEKIKMSHVCNGIMNDRVWLNGKPTVGWVRWLLSLSDLYLVSPDGRVQTDARSTYLSFVSNPCFLARFCVVLNTGGPHRLIYWNVWSLGVVLLDRA